MATQIKKVHKYGIKFDSKLELFFYELLQENNIPFDFQVTYTLHPTFKYNNETIRSMTLTVDFDFTAKGKNLIIDTKGFWRESNKQKWKWFRYVMKDKQPILYFPTSQKQCKELIEVIRKL